MVLFVSILSFKTKEFEGNYRVALFAFESRFALGAFERARHLQHLDSWNKEKHGETLEKVARVSRHFMGRVLETKKKNKHLISLEGIAFDAVFKWFYRVLLACTGFYLVLPSFFRVSTSFTGFEWDEKIFILRAEERVKIGKTRLVVNKNDEN